MDALRLANECLHQNQVESLPIGAKDVIQAIVAQGFEVFSYGQAKGFISHNGLSESTRNDAFTLVSGNLRIVFYRDDLSSGEKAFSLAHELGHIACGHISQGVKNKSEDYPENQQEQEANAFGYQFLAPLCILKKCRAKSIADIEKLTVLEQKRAPHVLGLLSVYKIDECDRLILSDFRTYIKARQRKQKCLLIGGGALVAMATVSLLLFSPTPAESPSAPSASLALTSVYSTRHAPAKTQSIIPTDKSTTTTFRRTTAFISAPGGKPTTISFPATTTREIYTATPTEPLTTRPQLTETMKQQIVLEIKNLYQPQYDRLKSTREKYMDEQRQKLVDIETQYEIDKTITQSLGGGTGYIQAKLDELLRKKNASIEEINRDMSEEQQEYEKALTDLDKEVETMIERRIAEYEQ